MNGEKGFSLVEILVAMVVLSLGLLGLASLQLKTTQNTQSAEFRSQATMLSYAIIDAMRANRSMALAGSYDLDFADAAPSGADLTLAESDVALWLEHLDEELPAADGEIDRNANEFTIRIRWDDSRGQQDPQIFEYKTVL